MLSGVSKVLELLMPGNLYIEPATILEQFGHHFINFARL